jgi:DNA primase
MVSRSRKLTAILLHHPQLSRDLEEAYGALPMSEAQRPLRDAMLAYFATAETAGLDATRADPNGGPPLDSAGLINHLHALGLSGELDLALEETPSCGRPDAQPAEAEAGWWHFYGLMHREGLEDAVEASRRQFVENPGDPAALARFNALCQALFRLRRGEQSESGEELDAAPFED